MPQMSVQNSFLRTSVWSNLGLPPGKGELEIAIIGAGIGESIVVHVGGGQWFIVDSCRDSSEDHSSNIPAPLRYLRALGVNVATDVAAVVATHWDSDHVAGIGDVVEACKSSIFSCAGALVRREFLQYQQRLMTGSAATNGAQVRDFSKVIDICDASRKKIKFASAGRELVVWDGAEFPFGKKCTLRSLSPSDEEFTLFLKEVLQDEPTEIESKRSAAARTPNLASVVLHIDWEDCSVLLGADMETSSSVGRGWSSVIQDAQDRSLSKSDLFKVAHHGSSNGHDDRIWQEMLKAEPVAMLTPYLRGKNEFCPPTQDDVGRITKLAPRSFITTRRYHNESATRPAVIKSGLSDLGITMKSKSKQMGIVRFRKAFGVASLWREELLGGACNLVDHFNQPNSKPHYL